MRASTIRKLATQLLIDIRFTEYLEQLQTAAQAEVPSKKKKKR